MSTDSVIKNEIENSKISSIPISYFFSFLISVNSLAQRATQEDIYGDSGVGGGGGFGGFLGLIIVGALLVWGFLTNKGFRLGVLAYVGFLGGIMLIFNSFGKDAGIAACIVAIIVLWIFDPSNRDKK